MIVDIPSAIQAVCTTASLGIIAYVVKWRDDHIKLTTKFDDHVLEDEKQFDKVGARFTEVIDRIGESEKNIIQIIRDKK